LAPGYARDHPVSKFVRTAGPMSYKMAGPPAPFTRQGITPRPVLPSFKRAIERNENPANALTSSNSGLSIMPHRDEEQLSVGFEYVGNSAGSSGGDVVNFASEDQSGRAISNRTLISGNTAERLGGAIILLLRKAIISLAIVD
jgi:hypothetical protein